LAVPAPTSVAVALTIGLFLVVGVLNLTVCLVIKGEHQ
jgi:hypothetical protein